MKATWITSSIAGVILGAVIHALEGNGEKANMAIVSPVFIVAVLVGVTGIGQFRELHAERKKRGLGFLGIMAKQEDFSRFYFPAWGRMLLCFVAVVVTTFSLKAWLP